MNNRRCNIWILGSGSGAYKNAIFWDVPPCSPVEGELPDYTAGNSRTYSLRTLLLREIRRPMASSDWIIGEMEKLGKRNGSG
jgi:hypothetical protein